MRHPPALGKMVVGNILTTAALRHADKPAFFCSATGRRYTFRQTNERCNRLAHALTGMGLKKGDKVAFLSSNRAEIVEIYFALAKTGLVGIPLNYRLAPGEIVSLIDDIGASALIAETRFAEAVAEVRAQLPQLRHHIWFGEPAGCPGQEYEALLATAPGGEPDVDVEEYDTYYFNLTSGTTGLPKCYSITHYNSTASSLFQTLEVSPRDVVLTVFPMFGRVGFGWAVCSVMYGIPNVLANFDADHVLALMESERVTVTNLVATMASMLLASPELAQRDLSRLRAVVFAGSLLPAPVRKACMARLCAGLYEYYGMQETGALVASTPEDRLRRPDSVGRAILFSEIRVIDAEGRPAASNVDGAILGRSPGAVTSYHDNPEKTAETFRDGWIHTGDLGRMDEEGYLYISGRLKEVIVTGGQNVHAGEVEELILGHAGVADCAVIGLPDAKWGERVTAVVVPREGQTVSGDEIIALCRRRLAGFKTPKTVVLQTEPLPRTPTGKVQKFKLVERHTTPSAATA